MIQPTMGYCTENQYKYFIKHVSKWEESQKKEGIETCKWVHEASLIYYIPHLRNYARDVFDFYFSEIRNLAS